MKHLTSEELVDLADGTRAEGSAPHLATCDACRAQLAGLRTMMSKAAAVDVPEPSPLFWEHFSARVSEAVAKEGAPGGAIGWRRLLSGWRLAIPLAAAAALVLVGVMLSVARSTVPVPVPRVADSAASSEAVEGTTMVPPDDPALDVVASLGTELDWDDLHDSGIVAHSGLVDRAVNGLSAGERVELGKLLKQELSSDGGGN